MRERDALHVFIGLVVVDAFDTYYDLHASDRFRRLHGLPAVVRLPAVAIVVVRCVDLSRVKTADRCESVSPVAL